MNLSAAEMKRMVDTMTPSQIKEWVQQAALLEWRKYFCRGTIEAATGVGKTRIGVLAADEVLSSSDDIVVVAVPTETLRDVDWPEEFRKWGFSKWLNSGRLFFVCHASMDRFKSPTGEIGLLVWDEVHNITNSNNTFTTNNQVFKVLGLSATLPKADGWELDQQKRAMIDKLCPSVFKIGLEEAIALKLVSPFEVVVLTFDLDDSSHTIEGGTAKKRTMTTEKHRYHELQQQVKRAGRSGNKNWLMACVNARMHFLYSLPQKERLAREVKKALEVEAAKEGRVKRTLFFCGGIDQANNLCGENVYHSKTKSTALEAFQRGEISYLGVVQALNEGKNINELDQIVVIQLNSKELDIIQRIGRSIRFREGHVARVIILVARGTKDEDWFEAAFTGFDQSRITKRYVRLQNPA